MARTYPRFLYSNPNNSKSPGPFIVHLLFPKFICRLVTTGEDRNKLTGPFYEHDGMCVEVLEIFEADDQTNRTMTKINSTIPRLFDWLQAQRLSKDIMLPYDVFMSF